ncbi:MAG: membrane protein insertion efficiency factor YidD [Pseudomonadota bacterium]
MNLLKKSLKKMDELAAFLPVGLILIYKNTASKLIGSVCRFQPTCSSYAEQAFRKHGFLRAFPLVAGRLLRCHPFNDGGHDPVR